MSLIDFYYSGSSADSLQEWNYLKGKGYVVKTHTSLVGSEPKAEDTNPLLHKERPRVQEMDSKRKNKWLVDGAFEVISTLNLEERAKKEDFWNQNYCITLASGIVGTLLGIGCGVATVFVKAAWLKVTCVVAAVALVLFAVLSFYRASDASDQANGWNMHPAVALQNQRMLAFQNGFVDTWLKSRQNYLTKNEMTYLLHQAFEKWNTQLESAKSTPSKRAAFTEEFLGSSLLAEHPIKQVLGNNKLETFCVQFQQCGYYAKDHREKYFSWQLKSLDEEKTKLLSVQDQEREKRDASINLTFATKKNALEQDRDKKLNKLKEAEQKKSEHPQVNPIKESFNLALQKAVKERDEALAASQKGCSTSKGQIEEIDKGIKGGIELRKKAGYDAFYQQAQDIFEGAYAVLKNQTPPPYSYKDPIWLFKEAVALAQNGPRERKTS